MVILRACIFAVLGFCAIIFYPFLLVWFVIGGGGGICTWVWFFSLSIIGCVGQFGEFFMV